MSSLERLPGDPDLIHETAQALAAAAEQLGGLTDVVYGLREAHWDSLAGRQFASRMTGPPRVFSALVRRYGLAAQALHTYADAFALAQRHSALAAERYDLATDTLAALWPLVGAAGDDTERARLQASCAQWQQCQADAEASWYAALHDYRAADARCAAQLDAATRDAITDSWAYQASHFVQNEGARVAMVGSLPSPWTKAIGVVAGGLSASAMVANKVFYDEGSWSGIGASAALSAVGSSGRVLKYAAKAGVSAIGPAEELGLGSRLLRGARAEAGGRLTAWKPSSHVTVDGPTFGAGPAGRAGRHAAPPADLSGTKVVRWGQVSVRKAQAGVQAGRDAAVKSFEQKYVADYRLALRGGPEAQKLLYGAWGVEGGLQAYKQAGKVRAYVAGRDDDRT